MIDMTILCSVRSNVWTKLIKLVQFMCCVFVLALLSKTDLVWWNEFNASLRLQTYSLTHCVSTLWFMHSCFLKGVREVPWWPMGK